MICSLLSFLISVCAYSHWSKSCTQVPKFQELRRSSLFSIPSLPGKSHQFYTVIYVIYDPPVFEVWTKRLLISIFLVVDHSRKILRDLSIMELVQFYIDHQILICLFSPSAIGHSEMQMTVHVIFRFSRRVFFIMARVVFEAKQQ